MVPNVDDSLEGADEVSPLLQSPTESRNGCGDSAAPSHRTQCSWSWKHVVIACIGLAVISDIGEYLYLAPRVRLFESVACSRYYLSEDPSLVDRDGSVPEHLCKINPVQDEVAFVIGWQLFFDSIPAILLPVPYGYLADKYGRKWILFLALISYTLSWASTLLFIGALNLPLQSVWLSSLFFILGGGPTVGTTLLTTMVADVVPPELRGTVFFYRFCTDLIAECFVPPITAILMTKNVWIPLLGAVMFQGLCPIIMLFVPETLPIAVVESASDGSSSSRSLILDGSDIAEEPLPTKDWRAQVRRLKESFEFVVRDGAVAALVFTFLISKVGRQSINIILQYVSKRYQWTLSKAGLLLSLRAGVNIALYTIILPSIATIALRRTNATRRDLCIAKGSIVLMTLGTLVLFSSATPALMIIGLIVYTLGTGFAPIVRSLVTSLVESHHASKTSDIARLYALISVMEGIGSLVAGPGMAWAFRFGMSLGQAWLGMPFALAATLFALVSLIVFAIKV